jgi:hypothetical protein
MHLGSHPCGAPRRAAIRSLRCRSTRPEVEKRALTSAAGINRSIRPTRSRNGRAGITPGRKPAGERRRDCRSSGLNQPFCLAKRCPPRLPAVSGWRTATCGRQDRLVPRR